MVCSWPWCWHGGRVITGGTALGESCCILLHPPCPNSRDKLPPAPPHPAQEPPRRGRDGGVGWNCATRSGPGGSGSARLPLSQIPFPDAASSKSPQALPHSPSFSWPAPSIPKVAQMAQKRTQLPLLSAGCTLRKQAAAQLF